MEKFEQSEKIIQVCEEEIPDFEKIEVNFTMKVKVKGKNPTEDVISIVIDRKSKITSTS